MRRHAGPRLSIRQTYRAIAQPKPGVASARAKTGGNHMSTKIGRDATRIQKLVKIRHAPLCAELSRRGQVQRLSLQHRMAPPAFMHSL
jgi:hypothetical protein